MVDMFGSIVGREVRMWREKGQSHQMGWEGGNCASSGDNESSNMQTEQYIRN